MRVSIVVPFFNEQENIDHFYLELCKIVDSRSESFEFIFVDDGSHDRTPFILERLSKQDNRVKGIILARNFGHQLALTSGMDYATGDAIITMDGDMQHPPALIPALLEAWHEGYDVVQTIRGSTAKVGFLKRMTSVGYYRCINWMSNIHITEGGSDFRLLDRQVLMNLLQFREHARFIRGIVSDIGYRQKCISFQAPARFAGKTKFSFRKMLHFALDGITAYSKMPLRLAFYLGLILGIGSILAVGYVLAVKYWYMDAVPGWATLAIALFLLGGVQLMFLGVIGEYIGRIFEEVKDRPLYWTRAVFGVDSSKMEYGKCKNDSVDM